MPLWHPLFFFFFKHIILNKRYSRIWTKQFLQGALENDRSIDLATGSVQQTEVGNVHVYAYIYTNVHMHITFDFRNHEFTLIPPVLVHHDRVFSCLLLPYFYVSSSSESWLPKKSVFTCSVL